MGEGELEYVNFFHKEPKSKEKKKFFLGGGGGVGRVDGWRGGGGRESRWMDS